MYVGEMLLESTKGYLTPIDDLARLALQSATETAERGSFTLSNTIEAELQILFDVDPYAPVLPLSAHGLGCDASNEGGTPHHAYLFPGFKIAE
jgi:hypothetical protein